jgi:16S rRNA (guanine966-N2)-methyltransferase
LGRRQHHLGDQLGLHPEQIPTEPLHVGLHTLDAERTPLRLDLLCAERLLRIAVAAHDVGKARHLVDGRLDGLTVLDLYAGTGAVALEALSRGAALVHAVEKDESASKAISANFDSIKSAELKGTFHLYTMGVHRFLGDQSQYRYHFIYIDPPYDVDDIDVIESLVQLQENDFLDPDAIIAIERNSRVKEISWPYGYEEMKVKNYGQATIFYGIPAGTSTGNSGGNPAEEGAENG